MAGDEVTATATGVRSTERARPVLGRLEPVELRTVFAHEALDFTPWIADNLDSLGAELGMALQLVGTEYSVGPFAIDVLAETPDGGRVVIENQLERSDHGHLGQCITYAAGVGATAVVWVLPHLLPEHRAALDWLNEHTDADVHFFGVTISLVQIGASVPAPRFEVEARPNDWQKHARTGAGSTQTRAGQSRGWSIAYAALAAVPAGHWTSIHDLAELVGTTPAWVGRHMYNMNHLPGFHRMLYRDGSVWQYFRWPDGRAGDPAEVRKALEAEGLGFDGAGRARRDRRLDATMLRDLIQSLPEVH